MPFFFFSLTLALAGFFLLVVWKATARGRAVLAAAVGMGLWLGLTLMLASRGFYRDFSSVPPRIAFAVIPALTTVAFLCASSRVRRGIARVPAWWLILAQTFRLPLEVALHRLYLSGVIPREMTYEGLNFDIITGLTAPIAAYLVWRGGRHARLARIAWNVLGLALVLTITVVSILCAPTVIQVFTSGPSNTFVAEAPFIWLPGFIVPSAILLHLLSLTAPWRDPD